MPRNQPSVKFKFCWIIEDSPVYSFFNTTSLLKISAHIFYSLNMFTKLMFRMLRYKQYPSFTATFFTSINSFF